MTRLCLAGVVAVLLAGVAGAAGQDPARQTPPVQDPSKPLPQTPPVQDPSKPATQTAGQTTAPPDPPPVPFDQWLAAFRTEAESKGITDATLDATLTNLQPDPVVISKDRAQPELTQTLDEYLAARMTETLLSKAAEVAVQNKALLKKVESRYGVPAPVMVAIWGLESRFGQITGSYSTISSLATLAWDARRTLFRNELIEALRIVDRGLVPADSLKGSWAGAIGQPQFMPSSFLKHAVDFDGDGTIDLWTSAPDVLGSMAEYLNAAGWVKGERWGREVRITPAVMVQIDAAVPLRTTGCKAQREMTATRPLSVWRRLGVRDVSGAALPAAALDAALVRGVTRDFLVYRNYEALLAYNCSDRYAVSAGLIADDVAVRSGVR